MQVRGVEDLRKVNGIARKFSRRSKLLGRWQDSTPSPFPALSKRACS